MKRNLNVFEACFCADKSQFAHISPIDFFFVYFILARCAEIAFIGFCTLPNVPKGATTDYLDTPSLYAVVAAINEQRSSFEGAVPKLDRIVGTRVSSVRARGLGPRPSQAWKPDLETPSASHSHATGQIPRCFAIKPNFMSTPS